MIAYAAAELLGAPLAEQGQQQHHTKRLQPGKVP
jgi:hypothetical protein